MMMSDVYEDLGMVQLGECSTPELFDDGTHPASYGLYSRDCESCELHEHKYDEFTKAYDARHPTCGNCQHWQGTDQYE